MRLSRVIPRRLCRVFSTAAAAMVLGCGSNSTGGDGTGSNGLTASIDGASFTASQTGASYSGGDLDVAGQITVGATVKKINIAVFGISGTGSYPLGEQPLNLATYNETTGATVLSWSSSFTGGAGTLVVTSLTATHVAGTFNFVAPAVTHTGSTGTKQFTGGTFSIDLH